MREEEQTCERRGQGRGKRGRGVEEERRVARKGKVGEEGATKNGGSRGWGP